MTDRDRLIELIEDGFPKNIAILFSKNIEDIADHLLANGVFILPEDLRGTDDFSISAFIEAMQMYKEKDRYIKPPCKVGDTIWYELYGEIESAVVYSCVGVFKNQGVEITDANAKSIDGLEVAFNGKCIGKTVFLTKEEAEQALVTDTNVGGKKEREG